VGTVAYYITGHGYGHAIRSATIANKIAESTNVIFRTSVPCHFFEREMHRNYVVAPARFDCGCLQTNSVSVSIKETLNEYRVLAHKNRELLHSEVCWCRENGVTLIVSDITPFAFEVANAASIPSIAITNFTWYDIYHDYLNEVPEFLPFLEEIKSQYCMADISLSLSPALPMEYFSTQKSMPLVGRCGNSCRQDILKQYGAQNSTAKIALIYVGDFGMEGADWQKLALFKDWLFLGINDLPGAPTNYCKIDFSRIPYPDLIASADCVISKLGYGVVSECMINATALIYLPRSRFVEYPVLEDAVKKWGGGVALSEEEFISINWHAALNRAVTIVNLQPPASDGAQQCAQAIESWLHNH